MTPGHYWCAAALVILATGCQRSDGAGAHVTFEGDHPWRVATASDSTWLLHNDSLRRGLWSFAQDDSASLLLGREGLYVTALHEILEEARTNMRGLGDPRRYCVSIGSLGHLRPPPQNLLDALATSDDTYVNAKQCAVDPALGVWDTVSARRAWLLWIQPGRGIWADSAVAQGGYHAEALMAAEWTCGMKSDHRKWRATKCTLLWVS
jgi:hypothetical protein